MSYKLLEELIPYLKEYENFENKGESSIDNFLAWAQQKRVADLELSEMEVKKLNGDISRYVGELYKHAKGYMKKVFIDTPFVSADDFAYLATLMQKGSMRKTELIFANIGEVSPGMEVIKRLLRHEFIHSFADPDDKRSSRVELTPKGRQAFFHMLHEMNFAGDIIVGDLSIAERMQLLNLLKRLRRFHQHIFEEARHEDIKVIHRQYAV